MEDGQKPEVLIAKFIFVTLLAILFMNSHEAQALDVNQLYKSVVAVGTSGGTLGTGIVIKVVSRKALILTAYHNVKIKQDTIWIEFYRVYKRWKGNLVKCDEERDVALVLVEDPPNQIKTICFGESPKLKEREEILAIVHTVAGKWKILEPKISGFDGGDITFSPRMGVRASGGPLLDSQKKLLIGMIRVKYVSELEKSLEGAALKSDIIREILDGWRGKIPGFEGKDLYELPLEKKLSISWSYSFFGDMLPLVEDVRWKFSRGMSLRLVYEPARRGKISSHKFGILCSSFKSKPLGDNPMGPLTSTVIIAFWSYESLLRIGNQYLGVGLAFGLGVGTHYLENGKFLPGGIEDRLGENDEATGPGVSLDGAIRYYLGNHWSISLGSEINSTRVYDGEVGYYSFYLAVGYRVSL